MKIIVIIVGLLIIHMIITIIVVRHKLRKPNDERFKGVSGEDGWRNNFYEPNNQDLLVEDVISSSSITYNNGCGSSEYIREVMSPTSKGEENELTDAICNGDTMPVDGDGVVHHEAVESSEEDERQIYFYVSNSEGLIDDNIISSPSITNNNGYGSSEYIREAASNPSKGEENELTDAIYNVDTMSVDGDGVVQLDSEKSLEEDEWQSYFHVPNSHDLVDVDDNPSFSSITNNNGYSSSGYIREASQNTSRGEENELEAAIYNGDVMTGYSVEHLDDGTNGKNARYDTSASMEHLQVSGICPNACIGAHKKDTVEKPKVSLDKVQFSAIAPKTFVKGDYSLIEIIMYEESFRHVVQEFIANADEPVKVTRSGILTAEREAKITIVLSSPDIEIKDNTETQLWQGKYLNFSFAVEMPEQYRKRQILFVASVYINDLIATRLKFIAKCRSSLDQKLNVIREDILSAFVSYASQDRNRVAMIIQGMKKARPDMDIFFDVDSLRSGDDWEKALWSEIDKRDILFLCWSKYARVSKWVDAEWRYALEHKGVDSIEPVPIDPPGSCPPPVELSCKHFNDKLLYIIYSDTNTTSTNNELT